MDKNECITALITTVIGFIIRAIEKRHLKKKGLLKDEKTEETQINK
jgi:hypothetical protein